MTDNVRENSLPEDPVPPLSDTSAADNAPTDPLPEPGAMPEEPPAAHAAPAPAATPTTAAPLNERQWAMFCHLIGFVGYFFPLGNIVGPLVLWLLKREESALVNDQGKEALNFQITWTVIICLNALLIFAVIGFVTLPLAILAHAILMIVATIKANEGVYYRYPATLRLID